MSTLKSSAEDLTLNADGSGNDIKFQSNAVEKASIDQDGNVVAAGTISSTGDTTITNGDIVFATAGKGICLGVTSNTDANTLEDYEEGTWTPTIRDLAGNLATLDVAQGSYTKIGRWVQINFNIRLTSKGSMTGNYVLLGGIPFEHPTESYNGTGVIDSWSNFDTDFSGIWWDTSSTGTVMWLVSVAAAGASSAAASGMVAAIGGNEVMKGSCMYQISV